MLIWLYSFLVQSTLFLGAAWLPIKFVPKLSLRSRESLKSSVGSPFRSPDSLWSM